MKELVIKDVVISNSGTPDFHGRIYTPEALQQAMEVLKARQSKRSLLVGELNDSPRAVQKTTIALENASHVAENLRMVEGKLMCDFKMLNTPMGKIAEQMMDADKQPVFAMRAFLRPGAGKDNVVKIDEFAPITFDIVNFK